MINVVVNPFLEEIQNLKEGAIFTFNGQYDRIARNLGHFPMAGWRCYLADVKPYQDYERAIHHFLPTSKVELCYPQYESIRIDHCKIGDVVFRHGVFWIITQKFKTVIRAMVLTTRENYMVKPGEVYSLRHDNYVGRATYVMTYGKTKTCTQKSLIVGDVYKTSFYHRLVVKVYKNGRQIILNLDKGSLIDFDFSKSQNFVDLIVATMTINLTPKRR